MIPLAPRLRALDKEKNGGQYGGRKEKLWGFSEILLMHEK